MKKIIAIFATLTLALVLVACNKPEPRTGEQVEITQTVTNVTGYDESNKPITKKTTTVTKMFVRPKRVATFSYGAADILNIGGLDKAGIELFGVAKGTGLPSMLSKFNDAKYPNVGDLFLPDDKVLKIMDPELIILDGRTAVKFDELTNMFPNADILDVSNTSYSVETQKEVVENLGKLFPEIKNVISARMTEIENSFANIQEKSKGVRASFLLSNGFGTGKINFNVYGKGSRYNSLFDEFGFEDADPGSAILGSHGKEIDFEYLGKVDADVIFILDRAVATGSTSSLDALRNEKLFKELRTSKNEDVYQLDAEGWYLVTGGFTSTEKMIEDIKVFTNK